MESCLITHCARTWNCWGDECPYYQQVYKLVLRLDTEIIQTKKDKFTRSMCKKTAWAVLEGAMEFFSQLLLTKHFDSRGQRIKWPECDLYDVIDDVKRVRVPERVTFPEEKWGKKAFESGRNKQGSSRGGSGGGVSYGGGQSQNNWQQHGTPAGTPPNFSNGTNGGRYGHLHPIIKEFMRDYNNKSMAE